ncbi:RDD family protein [Halomicrococcus gelatinilyticus]|uniref:RDD family protein n=1 Tax=Halomicrococcus gelatinilyticus TaxID=1702103 RepID=UPI002E0E75DF
MQDLHDDASGVGIRGVAMTIDAFVWFALLFVAVFAVATATGQLATTSNGLDADLEGTAASLALVLWLGLAVGYHSVLEWRFQQTLGKYLVGIQVVDGDGTAPSFGSSLARNVLRLLDWLPLFYGVGIAAILLSDQPRRVGDRVGGTLVVRT